VWTAFGFSVLFYFSDWPRVRPQPGTVMQVSSVDGSDAEEIYTGSILVAREDGKHCLERKFDNQTGAIWDQGLVNCGRVTVEERPKNTRVGTLSKYFKGR